MGMSLLRPVPGVVPSFAADSTAMPFVPLRTSSQNTQLPSTPLKGEAKMDEGGMRPSAAVQSSQKRAGGRVKGAREEVRVWRTLHPSDFLRSLLQVRD